MDIISTLALSKRAEPKIYSTKSFATTTAEPFVFKRITKATETSSSANNLFQWTEPDTADVSLVDRKVSKSSS